VSAGGRVARIAYASSPMSQMCNCGAAPFADTDKSSRLHFFVRTVAFFNEKKTIWLGNSPPPTGTLGIVLFVGFPKKCYGSCFDLEQLLTIFNICESKKTACGNRLEGGNAGQ